MADKETFVADVVMEGSSADLITAVEKFNRSLARTLKTVTEINAKSGRMTAAAKAELESATAQMEQQLARVSSMMATVNQLNRVGVRSQAILNNQAVGKRAVEAARLTKNLNDANDAYEALLIRQGRFRAENAKLEKSGKMISPSRQAMDDNFSGTIARLQTLNTQYTKLQDKVRQSGKDFSDQMAAIERARVQLFSQVSNPRTKQFTPYINALTDAQAALDQALKARPPKPVKAPALSVSQASKAEVDAAFAEAKRMDKLGPLRNRASALIGKIQEKDPGSLSPKEFADLQQLKSLVTQIDKEVEARRGQLNTLSKVGEDEAAAKRKVADQIEKAYDAKAKQDKALGAKETEEAKMFALAAERERKAKEALAKTTERREDANNRALNREIAAFEEENARNQRKLRLANAEAEAILTAKQLFGQGKASQALDMTEAYRDRLLSSKSNPNLLPGELENIQDELAINAARRKELIRLIGEQNKAESAARRQASEDRKREKADETERKTRRSQTFEIEKRASLLQITDLRTINELEAIRDKALARRKVILTELASNPMMSTDQRRRLLDEDSYRQNEVSSANSQISAKKNMRGGLGSVGYLGSAFARTGIYGLAAGAVYGLANAMQEGARFFIDYEDGLKRLQAISGSTDTQLSKMSDTILEVARGSRFATTELVEAATVLAQAGMSTGEIAKALPAISQLATASGSTLQQTSDVVTAALGSFQLSANETGRVADIMTSALNNTKLNLEQLALGIQYAGQTAAEQNITFDELTATVATMANAGIRSGSTQGTGLRAFLVDLQTPTKKLAETLSGLGISMEDIDVKTRGLLPVLETLQQKGFGSAEAYGSLETRAAAAYLVLKNNTDAIRDQIVAQQDLGLTALAAAKSMESVSAQWQRFKNNLGASTNDTGNMVLNFILRQMKDMNDAMEDQAVLQKELNRLRAEAGQSSMTLDQFDLMSAGAAGNGDAASQVINEQAAALNRLREDLPRIRAENEAFALSIEGYKTAMNEATAASTTHQTTIDSLDKAMNILNLRTKEYPDNSRALAVETLALTGRFEGLQAQIGGTVTSVGQLLGAMQALRSAEADLLINSLDTRVASAQRLGGAAINNAANIRRRALARGDLDPELRKLFEGVGPDNKKNQIIFARIREYNGKDKATANQYLGSVGEANIAVRESNNASRDRAVVSYLEGKTKDPTKNAEGKALNTEYLNAKTTEEKKALLAKWDKIYQEKGTSRLKKAAIGELSTRLQQSITEPPSAPAASNSGAATAANRAARNETFTQKDLQSLLEDELKNQFDEAERATTDEMFEAAITNAKAKLEEWKTTTRAVTEAEIAQKKADPAIQQRLRDQMEREIRLKQEEFDKDVADAFVKRLSTQLDLINAQFQAAMKRSEASLARVQGARSGLDRYSLRGKVTESDRILADRDVAIESEAKMVRDSENLGSYADSLQSEYDARKADLDEFGAKNGTTGGAYTTMARELEELRLKLEGVRDEKEALDAALNAGSQIPTTLAGSLRQAVAAYSEANMMNNTFGQNIRNGLYGAIENVHQGFNTFFTDIVTGTRSVGAAFGNMAKSVMNYLAQMAAQAAASSIFGTILSFAGSAFGGNSGKFISENSAAGLATAFNGGKIGGGTLSPPINPGYFVGGRAGYQTGGRVMNGSPLRDSVDAKLAKGEWVVRKAAVDTLGDDFMADLNKRGAGALKGLKGNNLIMAAKGPPPMTNVYVVAPENKQQMGPNDVLVTIHDDILRNGATKQLIKAVAAGQ